MAVRKKNEENIQALKAIDGILKIEIERHKSALKVEGKTHKARLVELNMLATKLNEVK